MKRIFMGAMAIAFMTGIANNANAQKGFNLSVKATPQFSFLQNKNDIDDNVNERKATFNTNFGVGAEYNFNNSYGVGFDVLYAIQGQKYETLATVKSEQKLEYIKIPLFFSYVADASKPVSFYGKIGPQISILSNAKLKDDNGDEVENKDKYEKTTFGGMAIGGVQFKLSEQLFLQTGFNFNYDFSNAEDKNYVGFPVYRPNTYNMTTGIQVGLKYQFSK